MDEQQRRVAIRRGPDAFILRGPAPGPKLAHQVHRLAGRVGGQALAQHRPKDGTEQAKISRQRGVKPGHGKPRFGHTIAKQIAVAPDEILHGGERLIVAIHHIDERRLPAQLHRQIFAECREHRCRHPFKGEQQDMRCCAAIHLPGQDLLRQGGGMREEIAHIRAIGTARIDDTANSEQQKPQNERQPVSAAPRLRAYGRPHRCHLCSSYRRA